MRIFVFLILLLFNTLLLTLSGCASLTKDDEAAQLHHQIGLGHMRSGNYPQALAELISAEKLDSTSATIQNSLGLAYFYRDRYDLSEKHFRKAIGINEKYTEAKNNLSQVLIERGKYKEASKVAQEVIDDLTFQYPEKGYLYLGIARFKMGQLESAKQPLLKSFEIKRDNCLALSYYGRVFYELKDFKKSSSTLDKAVGYCQKDQFDEPHYYSALSYYQLGEVEKTYVRLEEVIKLYPNGKYSDKAKSALETIQK